MIKKIKIKNFRSILDTTVELKPLTTIVGANATGKSNLIKAIDFISDIAEFGLQEAVYTRGGIPEILPKQLNNIYNQNIEIDLVFELEPPPYWENYELPNLLVDYSISFTKTKKSPLKINNESLKIHSLLLLQYYLQNKFHEENQETKKIKKFKLNEKLRTQYSESSINIFKTKQNKISFDINFNLSKENKALFLSWIGLGSIFQKDDRTVTSTDTKKLLSTILNQDKTGAENKTSAILSKTRFANNWISHYGNIVNEVQSYGRYDLLINELRQEQSISTEEKVSITGDNMPSIIKKFSKNNKKGWQRVMTTMSNISPYFANVYSESLRAGKEYLIFKEIFKGREIEAWESSDGTLRALAILISVESHKNGSTILIEEPEHGLHPWAIKELVSHIREVSNLNNLQIILTTHSQQVLECLRKEELLITERNEKGTKYSTIDDIIPNANISMGEIGELWTRGLLKGVPTSL